MPDIYARPISRPAAQPDILDTLRAALAADLRHKPVSKITALTSTAVSVWLGWIAFDAVLLPLEFSLPAIVLVAGNAWWQSQAIRRMGELRHASLLRRGALVGVTLAGLAADGVIAHFAIDAKAAEHGQHWSVWAVAACASVIALRNVLDRWLFCDDAPAASVSPHAIEIDIDPPPAAEQPVRAGPESVDNVYDLTADARLAHRAAMGPGERDVLSGLIRQQIAAADADRAAAIEAAIAAEAAHRAEMAARKDPVTKRWLPKDQWAQPAQSKRRRKAA
jgi:hypothetical protein